ncbi:MAG TPA: hypothetical protein VGR89_14540 [Puia sp.]|nr:hypothetical protein [Puia sp.]
MIKQRNRAALAAAISREFTRRYPFLRFEFPISHKPGSRNAQHTRDHNGLAAEEEARNVLEKEIGISDSMTVQDLEQSMAAYFDVPVLLCRKSGKNWIETRMTRRWTLKQQNDLGRDLSTAYLRVD